ncbi:MAG: thiamine pyrophosphate-binding protein [Gemmatimonadota bacterium]
MRKGDAFSGLPGDHTPQETSYYEVLERGSIREDEHPTVSEVLLRYLSLEGVTKIFGLPGHANMWLLDALGNQDEIEYIICRQETGAGYIAGGYSRVTGGLGVLLVTSGPGATNALTGTMNAQNSHTAVLTITGEIAERYFGMGYLQEGIDASLDVNAIYKNASRYSAMITNPMNFKVLFTQALRDALSTPHRASHVSLPADIAGCKYDRFQFPLGPENYRTTPKGSDPEEVKKAFETLTNPETSKRPLVYIGNGTRTALRDRARRDRFVEFLNKYAIPIVTSPDGKGIYPENDAMSLRNMGIATCLWPSEYIGKKEGDTVVSNYDNLLVLASSLGGLSTGNWKQLLPPTHAFIQVDLDQACIGRTMEIQQGIVAEVGRVIDQLCDLGEANEPDPEWVAERKEFLMEIKHTSPWKNPEWRSSDADPIHPARIMATLNEEMNRRTQRQGGGHIFVDAGNCVGWCVHYLVVNSPLEIHSALAMGPMGFGVGSVIGGKFGAPDHPCVAVVGDGAFLMHGNEVSTAAQHGVGAVWIVLNDNNLRMVSQGMTFEFGQPPDWEQQFEIGNPDLCKFAEGLGADAYPVTTPEQLEERLPKALDRAENGVPQVIVVHIDTTDEPPYYPPEKPPAPPRGYSC